MERNVLFLFLEVLDLSTMSSAQTVDVKIVLRRERFVTRPTLEVSPVLTTYFPLMWATSDVLGPLSQCLEL